MNQYGAPLRIDDDFRARSGVRNDVQMQTRIFTANDMPTVWSLSGMPQAMVYAPESTFENIYGDEEGLCRGTIFGDLYFPFEAASCGNGGMMR